MDSLTTIASTAEHTSAKTLAQALRMALIEEMRRDPNVILLGEDIGLYGGSFRVTEGLLEIFGEERVRDTPISETAIIGAALGAAMTGLRPVAEIQFNDFYTCCMDQLCNQAAKMRFMMGGQVKVPMVVRAPCGAVGRGAQHSQSLEAWFMHTPGLKVVMPSTPYDAKGLLKAAVRDDNPVMFFEHKLLYGSKSPGGKSASGEFDDTYREASDEDYVIPLGKADIKRHGNDVTVVATGYMVHKSLAAATQLAQSGISVEVLDPRTLSPLDWDTILQSVARTSRAVVVSEDVQMCGVASEIAAGIAERAFFELDAPVRRIAVPNTPIPFAPQMERRVIPQVGTIVDAIRSVLN